MRASRTIAAALAVIFVVGILSVTLMRRPGPRTSQKRPSRRRSLFDAQRDRRPHPGGLATRQGRQDIPFSFFKQLVLPPRVRIFSHLLLQGPQRRPGVCPSRPAAGEMVTSLSVYFQFFQAAEGGAFAPRSRVGP